MSILNNNHKYYLLKENEKQRNFIYNSHSGTQFDQRIRITRVTTVTSNMADGARHVFAITLRFEGETADELFETRATLTRPRLALQWWRILATTTSTLLTTPTDRLTDRPTPARIKRGTKIPRFDPVSEKKEQDFDIWSFFSWKLSTTGRKHITIYGVMDLVSFMILVWFYFTIFLYCGNRMYTVFGHCM